jgi:signal transduction histidine kinase/ActR/RegA family two-component response regulator
MRSKISGQAPLPDQELAAAYRPVARGYFLVTGIYYSIITFTHPFFEHGLTLGVLAGLALVSAIVCFASHRLLRRPDISLARLEGLTVLVNLAMFANVAAYLSIHYEEHKLVYFVLMSLVFATSSPTRRVTIPSIAVALGGLLIMAQKSSAEVSTQYMFVGLAGGFAAFGMSMLMRGAVIRELRARLAAEALNHQIGLELRRNDQLRAEAQALAVEAQAANRAKTEFLATMSHELRTPLNGVLGMAQAMAGGALDPTQAGQLAAIQASGQTLVGIINDILEISKIEAGHLDIVPAAFDLGRFADDKRDLYRGLAAEKGLDFHLEIERDARGWCHGDEVRLRQVFGNVLSNALKFTDSGSISVHIGRDGDLLTFTVTDTGVGIPAPLAPRLFEKFVQVDASSTRRFGGAGLGLAICREILLRMGGDIDFTSALGQGSRFTFRVPFEPMPAPAEGADHEVLDRPGADRRLQVLVVDDNATNRQVLQALLAQFDIATAAAETGAAALVAWEASAWDVILMDIHMPVMDGLTATAEIRARERASGRARTPIIAVTASVLSHETDAYFLAGMDDFVPKPIELKRLIGALDGCLDAPAQDQTDARASA